MTHNPNHNFKKDEVPHSPSKGVVTERNSSQNCSNDCRMNDMNNCHRTGKGKGTNNSCR